MANAAGIDESDPRWTLLLDRLTIEVIDPAAVEAELDALLAPLMAPDQSAESKRRELVAGLFDAAVKNAKLSTADLREMIGTDTYERLRYRQTLPLQLARALRTDSARLRYDPDHEARSAVILPHAEFTVLGGESGQGKTWRLCRTALTLADKGANAILVSAPRNFAAIVEAINQRAWHFAFEQSVPLETLTRRIGRVVGEIWLTLCIDDLQDRNQAEEISSR